MKAEYSRWLDFIVVPWASEIVTASNLRPRLKHCETDHWGTVDNKQPTEQIRRPPEASARPLRTHYFY